MFLSIKRDRLDRAERMPSYVPLLGLLRAGLGFRTNSALGMGTSHVVAADARQTYSTVSYQLFKNRVYFCR